jgi:hypothetical protein
MNWSVCVSLALTGLMVTASTLFSTISVPSVYLAYGTHANIPADGIVDDTGCRIIRGKVVNDLIDYIDPTKNICHS